MGVEERVGEEDRRIRSEIQIIIPGGLHESVRHEVLGGRLSYGVSMKPSRCVVSSSRTISLSRSIWRSYRIVS